MANRTLTIDLPGDIGTDPKLDARLDAIERKLDALLSRKSTADVVPLLLDFTAAAKKLGVSRRKLFEWRQAGEIPTVTIDGAQWIRAEALEEFARRHEQEFQPAGV